MNPIDFLFTLLRKFVPIKETEFASMHREAEDWHLKMIDKEPDNAFEAAYKAHAPKWYFKLALAVSWIFAVKGIANFLTEAKDEEKANGTNDSW